MRFSDKANLFVRRERKAMGFVGEKTAELPQDKSKASSAFLFFEILCKKKKFLMTVGRLELEQRLRK